MSTFIGLVVLALSSETSLLDQTADGSQPKRTDPKLFRAGASAVDIAPTAFPVLVNGGFLQNRATRVNDPIRAKCIALDDGSIRLAIVVVDSCMMPRELLDQAKELARARIGIPTERILISATHTHSAPAAMGALGCPADASYVSLLPARIADSIQRAVRNLEPARVGWGSIDDPAHTYCRRWIRRPDKILDDPFGQKTVRANMHPGYQNADAIAPAGPVDPGLTLLSIQSRSGRPIGVLANYSMHYYGAEPVSADYFGRFATAFAKRINADGVDPPFVGIMSQGTSGDQMWMDYGQPKKDPGLDAFAADVAQIAHQAYQVIAYHDWVPLAMTETKLVLSRRVPDASRLAWAKTVVGRMGNRAIPSNLSEVYAKEAIFLHEEPRRELKLQAIRIGELGIAAIPNEVFAISGLKIKAQSPFETTMNIELANGSEGYIPPPEQHALGGYTTWPARTAGLEVQAEPKIVAATLGLLEQVAEKPRRLMRVWNGSYAEAILASQPWAYWRLDDIQGLLALDSSGNTRHARYEGRVAFYLPGEGVRSTSKPINRAAHFAGGRLKAEFAGIGENYSVELWFWNGLPNDVRPITGQLFSIELRRTDKAQSDRLCIGGIESARGRLFFSSKTETANDVLAGKTEILAKTWHHLALVRHAGQVVVYLDGNPESELSGNTQLTPIEKTSLLSIRAGSGSSDSFEGKIDEVAVYNRALPTEEIVKHFRAAK